MVEIELNLIGVVFGTNNEFPVGARRNRDTGAKPDGCRHDETIVVVRVFADQVDSSRRLIDLRGRSELPHEAPAKAFDALVYFGVRFVHRLSDSPLLPQPVDGSNILVLAEIFPAL